MKQGQSLTAIAAELERQVGSRKDYIAKQGALKAVVAGEDRQVKISGLNGDPLGMTETAHDQVAGRLEIPKKYYDRMRGQDPELLAHNINTWLQKAGNDQRMVRTLDGRVRAFLSNRYRPLDNIDLARTALPALQQAEARVISAEITEQRFYIKALFPQLSDTIPEGLQLGQGHNFMLEDKVVATLTITNSEVGCGSLRVEPGVFKTRCTNLAIFAESSMKKYHVGRSAIAELDNAVEHFTDETRQADDRAFWMKVRDIVKAACNQEVFRAHVEKMRAAAGVRIESQDIPAVVEVTRKVLGLGEGLQNGLLTHLIQGGDLTKWGLLNAITRTAEDQQSYDVATDLERAGGKVLELSPNDWKVITTAKS